MDIPPKGEGKSQMIHVKILPHFKSLFPAGSATYRDRVHELLDSFQHEPWSFMVKACLRHPCWGVADEDSDQVKKALEQLCRQPVADVVHAAFERLTRLIPPETKTIEVHLHPGPAANKGGGATFAPGKVLIGVPTSHDWEIRVQRNCAHEYSHCLRMAIWPHDDHHGFGEARPHNVRDYLVFEGLAEVLADELYPHPDFTSPEISSRDAIAYWDYIEPHLDETGWPAYVKSMFCEDASNLPSMAGYRIGEQIVRTFMGKTGTKAVEIQRLPYEEIYWNSGYLLLR